MLEAGLVKHYEMTVQYKDTAAALGSGGLEVFATPAMITLMEGTAFYLAAEHLEEGLSTVGTKVEISHDSAALIGETVRCDAELTKVDGRRLEFNVKVTGRHGLIGQGRHERFVINSEKFLKKLADRNNA